MRAAPAVSISIDRFATVRVAIALLCGAAYAALLAWLASWSAHQPAWILGAPALGCLAIVAAAWRSMPGPVRLRWDGQRWHLAPIATAGEGGTDAAGDVEVALDLGGWMLLRWCGDGHGRWRPAHWLPVQRRGLERDWHALRCAVYSPRPAFRPGSAADT